VRVPPRGPTGGRRGSGPPRRGCPPARLHLPRRGHPAAPGTRLPPRPPRGGGSGPGPAARLARAGLLRLLSGHRPGPPGGREVFRQGDREPCRCPARAHLVHGVGEPRRPAERVVGRAAGPDPRTASTAHTAATERHPLPPGVRLL